MAKNRMLQFVTVDKETPEKRPANLRAHDFHEIYREYAAEKAAEQAGRCSQCGVPYCQSHCPLHNNIPDWLRLTAEGRLQEAYEISQATNTFPEICGRICPQDRLCEGNCVIEQSGHGTVTIGSVEKYITDTAWENGWVQPIKPHAERTESVGIIGAGPGGLAAADMLRRKGVQVTVYDRHDRAGGLLTYGIPGFKLEKPVVMQRIDQLEEAGVQFVLEINGGLAERLGIAPGAELRHPSIGTGDYIHRRISGGDTKLVARYNIRIPDEPCHAQQQAKAQQHDRGAPAHQPIRRRAQYFLHLLGAEFYEVSFFCHFLRFTVHGLRYTVDGTRWTVHGGRYTVRSGLRVPCTVYRKPCTVYRQFKRRIIPNTIASSI